MFLLICASNNILAQVLQGEPYCASCGKKQQQQEIEKAAIEAGKVSKADRNNNINCSFFVTIRLQSVSVKNNKS